MFIGRMDQEKTQLKCLPKPLAAAFAETLAHDFSQLPAGKYALTSVPGSFFTIQDDRTKFATETKPEAHTKFIDIQYLLKGKERFGMAKTQILQATEDQMEEKDVAFYPAPKGEFFADALPGDFMIFFPPEIHRPMGCIGSPEDIRKVVIKIPFAALD